MRQELAEELAVLLTAHMQGEELQDVKMRMEIILNNYDIRKRTTDLVVWNEQKNTAIIKRYIAAKTAAGLSYRSIKYYQQTLQSFFDYVGKDFDTITADDLRLYFALRVQRDKVSKTTANNERRNLSSFYGWLQKEEILLKNPMLKVEAIRETKKKKKAYALMDLEKIRLGCRTAREKAIVEILASTWCRVAELSGIRIDDICEGKITVKGKGDKYRDVYLNARAQLALEIYLKERTDHNPYLFPKARFAGNLKAMTSKARPSELPEWYKYPEMVDEHEPTGPGTIESIIRGIGKRAGVKDCHPHRFRRTGATMALRTGMPITTVQKLLGHNSIETTQIYLDISDDELEQAHKKYVT